MTLEISKEEMHFWEHNPGFDSFEEYQEYCNWTKEYDRWIQEHPEEYEAMWERIESESLENYKQGLVIPK